ncbi:hypothetical protein ACAW74_22615 [Fibrella sp. WM1]|uniref:hypothetical protein n=1 Tax=Fibrella musci TaxID=3242485 RepID=UPI0035224F3A
MNTSTKHTLIALSFTALLGACSRPVATFQPSKAERFYTQQTTATPAAATETVAPEAAPAVAATPAVAEVATPAATKADIETMLVKAEAVASAKARPAEARKLERRITKIREVLNTTPASSMAPAAPVKKAGLAQRLMMKSMDKKIQKHLAPEQPMRSSTLTAGLVIGLIGLLLLLLTTGTAATIGLIALVVGIVLVILGLL